MHMPNTSLPEKADKVKNFTFLLEKTFVVKLQFGAPKSARTQRLKTLGTILTNQTRTNGKNIFIRTKN